MSTAPVDRNHLTDSYLLYYSGEHVWYETQMFFVAAAAILSGVTLQSPNAELVFLLPNAIVEALGFHLRNLLDFFRPDPKKKPQKTDVFAETFSTTSSYRMSFPNSPALLHMPE